MAESKECSPFVPGGEFIHRLNAALGLEGEHITSIRLIFDMDDLCRVEIEKHADLGQIEEVVRVLEYFDVGEHLESPKPDLSDVLDEFRGFEVVDTKTTRQPVETTCLGDEWKTYENGNDVFLTVHLRKPVHG